MPALAILLPSAIGVCGLVIDGSLVSAASRRIQQVADGAATAAAAELRVTGSGAVATAERYVRQLNGLASAVVTTNVPPQTGSYAGDRRYVEVIIEHHVATHLLRFGGPASVRARAVAGIENVTAPAALMVLDPDPPNINVSALPITVPSVTPLIGGLEVLGLGAVTVQGAVIVNNTWGGLDENGDEVGESFLRHACTCTPVLPLTRLRATDIRVVGGVCNPQAYRGIDSGDRSPLHANRHPVPDPYSSLAPPTTSSDPINVSSEYRGGVTVAGIPLIGPPIILRPGVYEWITIISGKVVFSPGIYVIRGKHPLTGIGLSLIAGEVQANGVMFYLTDSPSYSTSGSNPDQSDGETSPGNPGALTVLPSALIDLALPGSSFSGLDSPGSPYHGMVIMQRRFDRRPILLVRQSLLGGVSFEGNIYAKWAEVAILGQGEFRTAIASGSLRVVDVVDCRFVPKNPLPPATDVFLVE